MKCRSPFSFTTNMPGDITRTDYKTFQDFYPYYLEEHANRTNRRLHVIGSMLAGLTMLTVLFTFNFRYIWLPLLVGYAFAWVGFINSILLRMI